jgi:glycosyltransferase involved in cell wall biosynthesis
VTRTAKSQSPVRLRQKAIPSTMPRAMPDVLLVSKPIAPPWHDSSKNLVRDLASHLRRYTPVLMSRRDARLDIPRARIEPIYPAFAADSGFAPALRDNARVLERLLWGTKTDLWHFFFAPNPKTSSVARWSGRARRMRAIQTVCSAPAEHVDLRRVLFAQRVVVLSEHTLRRFVDAGIPERRIALIRPAIAALTPPTASSAQELRVQLGLPPDRPVVVYAGDLEFGRGADLALEAHADLPKSMGAELIMACRAKTPRARERAAELRARVDALGIAEHVRFLGETPRIHALLAVADLVTLPTDSLYAKMDLPLVLIEAMSLARAVLVGTGTPAQELAAGGGALAVATQRDAVSTATRKLLEDATQRAELGARARQVALREYSPEHMAARYETVYDEICA